jgi:hypothetical protein
VRCARLPLRTVALEPWPSVLMSTRASKGLCLCTRSCVCVCVCVCVSVCVCECVGPVTAPGPNSSSSPVMSNGFCSQNGRWPDPKSSRQKGGAGYFPNYSIFYICAVKAVVALALVAALCRVPTPLLSMLLPRPLLLTHTHTHTCTHAPGDSTGLLAEFGRGRRADAAGGRVVAELGLAVAGRVGNSSRRVGPAVAGRVARATPADPVHPRHPRSQCAGEVRKRW